MSSRMAFVAFVSSGRVAHSSKEFPSGLVRTTVAWAVRVDGNRPELVWYRVWFDALRGTL